MRSSERSGCGRHRLGGRRDELQHLSWVGDHGHVVGRGLHGGGAHPGGERPLGIGRDRLVAVGDRNQHGSDVQAATPTTPSRALWCNGCWTANMTLA